jgi:hypothetical protein
MFLAGGLPATFKLSGHITSQISAAILLHSFIHSFIPVVVSLTTVP